LLHRIALKQNKPVVGLETVEAQIGAMQGIPMAQQLLLLRSAARHHDEVVKMVKQLIEYYLREDLEGILHLQDALDASLGDDVRAAQDVLVERVLIGRNAGMAQRTAKLADAGGAFVAVGALHLQGERGVLAELEQRGYRVTRVPLTKAP
jgi:uncharacterized protein YbaP (TraB family)